MFSEAVKAFASTVRPVIAHFKMFSHREINFTLPFRLMSHFDSPRTTNGCIFEKCHSVLIVTSNYLWWHLTTLKQIGTFFYFGYEPDVDPLQSFPYGARTQQTDIWTVFLKGLCQSGTIKSRFSLRESLSELEICNCFWASDDQNFCLNNPQNTFFFSLLFFLSRMFISRYSGPEVLKWSVYTSNHACRNFLFYCNSHFGCQMYYLINAFELVLRAGDVSCHLVSWFCACFVDPRRHGTAGQVKEALFSPDNIYFNILCVDSIWTQPLTFSLSLSLGPALTQPSIPLGTWWPVNFASPLRLCCWPRTPTSTGGKNTRRKVAPHR